MKPIHSDPLPHIPSCKIRGRLIPAYEFLPRLRTLCSSLGFNNPIVTRPGEATRNLAERLSLGFPSTPDEAWGAQDHIVILSAMVPYEQKWGAYTGLPGQLSPDSGAGPAATAAEFIEPYVRLYQLAREQIHLGCDGAGKPVVTLPEALLTGQAGTAGVGLRVDLTKIAETGGPLPEPAPSAGSRVSLPLSGDFRKTLGEREFSWQPGVFMAIGDVLTPEFFSFTAQPGQALPSPFPEVLAAIPWIVVDRNPHLTATLVHLHSGFSGVCETFAATGPDDLRNLLCVAGLEIDMKGFRGRKERYCVPWQACWKRHGHCYGNIYPLHQDDLLVALMNYNRMGSGAEYAGTDWP